MGFSEICIVFHTGLSEWMTVGGIMIWKTYTSQHLKS